MNELEYILEVHRREERRFNAMMDTVILLTVLAVGLIIHACGR